MKSIHRSSLARALVLSLMYASALLLCQWLAFQIRFDFDIPKKHLGDFTLHWHWQIAVKFLFLLGFGQFSGLLSYFGVPDVIRLFYAVLGASATFVAIRLLNIENYHPPRGVLLIDFILSFLALTMIRLEFRLLRERFQSPQEGSSRRARRVAIIGAGDVGANLARELSTKRGPGLMPVAFFDDDPVKWNARVHGIPVLGRPESLLNQRLRLNLNLQQVIIALPGAPAKRVGEIIKVLQQTRLSFGMVPSLEQLATGKVKVSQLRSVEIQDLLGREPVQLETENIRSILQDQVVIVTGAGGSIGSELCRQILTFNPRRLILIEQTEYLLFQIGQELKEAGWAGTIQPLVADICDEPQMRQIFQLFAPSTLFHAAAHKHVPLMEDQPAEAIRNNSLGTARLAELALEYKLERFILISTDKAINPTNVMGATKRLAETFIQSLNASKPDPQGSGTRFMAVRFGNVLGSSGSVIPTFNKQIEAGGPVKVTHPDITRYFMTIPEAVGLVLQSASQGTGGEIFVLSMGEPVKIIDLAKQLIELSGRRPGEDIQIEITGLRPGEKLFEELSYKGENITTTSHSKIMRFVCQPTPLDQVRKTLHEIADGMGELENNQLKLRLQKAVPEYRPYLA